MLRFRVLGPFEVEADHGLVDLGSARRRALLGVLTLNAGRVVGTERLVDTLWGESPPRTAVHVLHVYISDLRRVLPDGVLRTVSPGYLLRVPGQAVDLNEFEELVARGRADFTRGATAAAVVSLEQALGMWRGPVLQDLESEGFVQVEARRLEELRTEVRELRAEAKLAVGAAQDVVADLQALIRDHPFREHSHALLMRALAAAGRQSDALALFGDIRARLADELGIEPSEGLRSAQTAVLRQETTPTAERRSPGLVLAVTTELSRLPALARTAASTARAAGRELLLTTILDATTTTPADLTKAAAATRIAQSEVTVPGRSAAFRSRRQSHDLASLAAEYDADLTVLDSPDLIGSRGQLAGWARAVMEQLTTDVALVAGGPPTPGLPIAVPFGGSDHDWAAAELAALLSKATDAPLLVVGAITPHDDASRLIARLALAVQQVLGITAEPILVEATIPGLLGALRDTNPVIGVSERWRSEGIGPFRREILQGTTSALILRRGLRPGLLSSSTSATRFAWSTLA
jgi:DNA-binding SARP family transcriptional activator